MKNNIQFLLFLGLATLVLSWLAPSPVTPKMASQPPMLHANSPADPRPVTASLRERRAKSRPRAGSIIALTPVAEAGAPTVQAATNTFSLPRYLTPEEVELEVNGLLVEVTGSEQIASSEEVLETSGPERFLTAEEAEVEVNGRTSN